MRPIALAPLALLLSACATQPPAQYQPAPTASLAPDVAANLYAAQVAATQAQQATNAAQHATQAVSTATWQALELRQAEAQSTIDYQRAINDMAMTQQAISLTSQAASVGATLTQAAINDRLAEGTSTAQARGFEYSQKLDEQSKRVKDSGAANAIWALAGLIVVFGATWAGVGAAMAAVHRWRNAPHIIPAGMQVYAPAPVQAPALPPLTDNPPQFSLDSASRETLDGLRLLRDALIYQEQSPEFSPRQIPRWERLRDASLPQFGTGSAWSAARAHFGALLISDSDGTTVADGDVQTLYDAIKSGRVALPYPIPASS